MTVAAADLRRGAVVGTAEVVAERVAGRDVVRCTGSGPLTPRRLPDRVLLLGATAGPLGGDVHRISVRVGPRAQLRLGSVAAAIVLPGTGSPAVVEVDIEVSAGAELVWEPEPTVVVEGAELRSTTNIRMAGDARLFRRDELVLGRHGEGPGSVRARLDIVRDGRAVIRQEVALGPGVPAVTDHDQITEIIRIGHDAVPAEVVPVGGGWQGRWSPTHGVVREISSRRRSSPQVPNVVR
ncbi:MAG: urease accessory protein UreD [Actinomycetota bacterium]